MKLKKSGETALIILVSLITIIGLSDFVFVLKNPIPTENIPTAQQQNQLLSMQKITLTTVDNKAIAAVLWPVENPKGWIVLAHMMPATKESWFDLAQALQNEGYESIAIDFRGHGESEGGPNGYQNFSDADHQKSIFDIDSAVKYIESRGATKEKISFIGASVGANLVLQYFVNHSEPKIVILLSPGVNYRGIKAELFAQKLKAGQRILMIGARDDERSGGNIENQIKKISDAIPAGIEKEIKIYDTGGHGTDILKARSELLELIIKFITDIPK